MQLKICLCFSSSFCRLPIKHTCFSFLRKIVLRPGSQRFPNQHTTQDIAKNHGTYIIKLFFVPLIKTVQHFLTKFPMKTLQKKLPLSQCLYNFHFHIPKTTPSGQHIAPLFLPKYYFYTELSADSIVSLPN